MKKKAMLNTFLKYVSLNVLGMLGLSCYILADTFFVSKGMGANGLTALNLAIPIYSFINGTGLMLGIGGATKYSILQAQQKNEEANKIYSHAILLGLSTGILFLFCGMFFSNHLSLLLGGNEHTAAMTSIYLKTILVFAPFFIMNNVLIGFIRNDGSPRLSMAAMLIGSFSNIILDYIFIFPLQLGMFGAALATGLAPIISLLLLSSYFIKKNNQFHLVKFKPHMPSIKEIGALGTSSLITEVSSGIVIIVFNMVILNLEGNIGVAAYGIIANLALVAIAIFTGVGQGIQPMISTNYGKGNHRNIYTVLRYSIVLVIPIAIVMYITVYFFSDQLISIFNSDNDLLLAELASTGLHLYFTAFIFAGFNIITASFFSSVELPVKSFIISIVRGCVAIIPLVVILAHFFGMTGVWIAYTCAELLTAIVALSFLLKATRSRSMNSHTNEHAISDQ